MCVIVHLHVVQSESGNEHYALDGGQETSNPRERAGAAEHRVVRRHRQAVRCHARRHSGTRFRRASVRYPIHVPCTSSTHACVPCRNHPILLPSRPHEGRPASPVQGLARKPRCVIPSPVHPWTRSPVVFTPASTAAESSPERTNDGARLLLQTRYRNLASPRPTDRPLLRCFPAPSV